MFIATNQQAADINTLAVSPSITAWLHCEVVDALRSTYSPNEVTTIKFARPKRLAYIMY